MEAKARINRNLVKKYDQWMAAMHNAKTTQCTYRKAIGQYIESMGKKSIADADNTDIR
jgi:hypothetical protein